MDGQRILVGIEHSSAENAALQQAWALPGGEFGPALLQTGWTGRQDGVASEAMFAMMRRLHTLKERGFAIDVVAFNGVRDAAQRARSAHLPAQGPHEAAQTENIAVAADRGDYDYVLVLVGSLHALTKPVDLGRGEFVPMAGVLRRHGKVVTLGMEDAGGSAWNCTLAPDAKIEPDTPVTSDMIRCAAHPAGDGTDRGATAFLSLAPGESEDHDGIFYVGRISASPPADPGD